VKNRFSVEDAVDELKQRFEQEGDLNLDQRDIDALLAKAELSHEEFNTAAARHLGQRFLDGALDFEFCDVLINELYKMTYVFGESGHSELFWDVFNAFDQGEYHHDNDRSEDPVETYTRPRLVECLTKH